MMILATLAAVAVALLICLAVVFDTIDAEMAPPPPRRGFNPTEPPRRD